MWGGLKNLDFKGFFHFLLFGHSPKLTAISTQYYRHAKIQLPNPISHQLFKTHFSPNLISPQLRKTPLQSKTPFFTQSQKRHQTQTPKNAPPLFIPPHPQTSFPPQCQNPPQRNLPLNRKTHHAPKIQKRTAALKRPNPARRINAVSANGTASTEGAKIKTPQITEHTFELSTSYPHYPQG